MDMVPILLGQLQALEKEKQETLATLNRIEGGERVLRFLIAKSQQPEELKTEVPANGQ